MKTLKLFFVLIPMVAFFGCEKKDDRISVEKYVRLLKTNKYKNAELPAFTLEDISELLKYRNEKNVITNFPRNSLSSVFHVEVELGIYILWTIESIRMASVTGYTRMFPSLEPFLIPRNPEDFELDYDQAAHQQEAHQTASNAYYNWWTRSFVSSLSFDLYIQIDPLKDTKYKWY